MYTDSESVRLVYVRKAQRNMRQDCGEQEDFSSSSKGDIVGGDREKKKREYLGKCNGFFIKNYQGKMRLFVFF